MNKNPIPFLLVLSIVFAFPGDLDAQVPVTLDGYQTFASSPAAAVATTAKQARVSDVTIILDVSTSMPGGMPPPPPWTFGPGVVAIEYPAPIVDPPPTLLSGGFPGPAPVIGLSLPKIVTIIIPAQNFPAAGTFTLVLEVQSVHLDVSVLEVQPVVPLYARLSRFDLNNTVSGALATRLALAPAQFHVADAINCIGVTGPSPNDVTADLVRTELVFSTTGVNVTAPPLPLPVQVNVTERVAGAFAGAQLTFNLTGFPDGFLVDTVNTSVQNGMINAIGQISNGSGTITATPNNTAGIDTLILNLAIEGSAGNSGEGRLTATLGPPALFSPLNFPDPPLRILSVLPTHTQLVFDYCVAVPGVFDTGFAITNAPPGAAQGPITVVFFPTSGPTFTLTTSAAAAPGTGLNAAGLLEPGQSWSVLLSDLLQAAGAPANFTGAIRMATEFSAHGVNFVADAGFQNIAQGYPARILGPARRLFALDGIVGKNQILP